MIKIRSLTRLCGHLLFLGLPLIAGEPPRELDRVIQHFMNLESTSVQIKQVIDWRFSDASDTVEIQMDIRGNRRFHVTLPGFGLEIFVTESEMVTLNHARKQILYETASPDALLKQLFVGGDLNKAKFKGSKALKQGGKRLNFVFNDDFSDWERLSVDLNEIEQLQALNLMDYDGNEYLISLRYLDAYRSFQVPAPGSDYLHYDMADLRE